MSRATNSERSPLLRIQSRQSDAPSFAVADVAPSTFQITAVCLLVAAAHTIATYAAVSAAGPAQGLNQAALCRRLYDHVADPANDPRCLEPAVQRQLADVESGEAILRAVLAVLMPIPIGMAADRYGRRPFLVLALVGSVLNVGSRIFIYEFPHTFPLKLTWLSTSLEHLAGGGTTLLAMLYTILTDVTSARQRSTSFFYLIATNVAAIQIAMKLTELVSTKFGPWPVLLAAFGIFIFAILCAFCIEETMHLNKVVENEEAVEDEPAAQSTMDRIRAAVPAAYKQASTSMAALFYRDRRLAILLLTTLLTSTSTQALGFLPIYVSYRYDLPIDKGFPMLNVGNIVYFVLTALLLPLASFALLSFNYSALRKDIIFTRWGVVAAAIGLLGIGLAPKLGFLMAAFIVVSLAAAYHGGVRGLLSQLTGEDHVAVMFATTKVLGTIGNLVGELLSKFLFDLGSKIGKAWSGLPYIVYGLVFVSAAAVIFAVTTGASDETEREGVYDEQD